MSNQFACFAEICVSVSIVGGKFGLMELVWGRLPIFRLIWREHHGAQ
jgi:hypothetical protein